MEKIILLWLMFSAILNPKSLEFTLKEEDIIQLRIDAVLCTIAECDKYVFCYAHPAGYLNIEIGGNAFDVSPREVYHF